VYLRGTTYLRTPLFGIIPVVTLFVVCAGAVGTWLWDDMPLNSPKRLPYWNSTSGFYFDHITAVDVSFCTILRNFIQISTKNGRTMTENDVISIFTMADLRHLGFYRFDIWFFKSPCTTSYRSSTETIALNCLVGILARDRLICRQTDRPVAISRSRCRERRLNNVTY